MRLYVDTEFNGFGGELISMAVVSDEGHEWYEVLPLPEVVDPWVEANVVPCLGKAPVDSLAFRMCLHSWLKQFESPTVIADWYTDLVHFFSVFAGRDHSECFMYPCKAQLMDISEYESAVPHNALSDARAIRAAVKRMLA